MKNDLHIAGIYTALDMEMFHTGCPTEINIKFKMNTQPQGNLHTSNKLKLSLSVQLGLGPS